jgi:sugar lactone lactonase YvrE
MGTTNGVELSPDEKVLYVNESVQRNVWKYDILEDGAVTNKRLHIQFADGGLDGMKCDRDGNLYIARYGKGNIAVVSANGKIIREIALHGNKPTNITFGGAGGTTCYVTMQDRGCFETFRADVPGKKWK